MLSDVAAIIRRLQDLRDEFWDRVRAGDRAGARQVRTEIESLAQWIDLDPYEDDVLNHAWGAVSGDVRINLSFLGKGETPPEVWEIRDQLARMDDEFVQALDDGEDAPGGQHPAHTNYLRVVEYFASLPPDLRRHPLVLHAVSRSKHSFFGVVGGFPILEPSPEERAALKVRRLYRWTEDLRRARFLCELAPSSEDAHEDWFAEPIGTETTIRELVEAAGAECEGLDWASREDGWALLLTLSTEPDWETEDLMAVLRPSSLFTVARIDELFTSTDIECGDSLNYPFQDSWSEDGLDEEELAAYRAQQEREREWRRQILATTPCRVCGRLVGEDERCSIDWVPRGSSILNDDDSVLVEGPAAIVRCPEHR